MIISRKMLPERQLNIDGKFVETVKKFEYLGFRLNSKVDDSSEIRRRLGIARSAVTSLVQIWRDKAISIPTKLKLLNTLIFPIATYAAECWTMKKRDKERINSFELWCFRRLPWVKWREHKTNVWVIHQIKLKIKLLQTIYQRKPRFFRDITRDIT